MSYQFNVYKNTDTDSGGVNISQSITYHLASRTKLTSIPQTFTTPVKLNLFSVYYLFLDLKSKYFRHVIAHRGRVNQYRIV